MFHLTKFALFTLIIGVWVSFGQTPVDLSLLPDDALAFKIGSENDKEATAAVLETFRRGERMIPHLLKLKGMKSIYQGFCLNDSQGGVGFARPDEDTSPEGRNPDTGYYITSEVAALYLISAIYYNNLSFAQVPYLRGMKSVGNRRYNTRKRVRRAWQATEKWYHGKYLKKGLAKVRDEQEYPLKSAKLFFVGHSPSRQRDLSDCGQ